MSDEQPQPKISELNEEQKQLLEVYRERLLKTALCCDPADRPRAETNITRLYQQIGREKPLFVWVDSPATGSIIVHILGNAGMCDSLQSYLEVTSKSKKDLKAFEKDLRARLKKRGKLRVDIPTHKIPGSRPLLDSVCDSIAQVAYEPTDKAMLTKEQVMPALLRLIDDHRSSVESDKEIVCGWLSESAKYFMDVAYWGQHEGWWLTFYLFCQELGVKYSAESELNLQIWNEIVQSCGFFAVWRELCLACERPLVQKLNEEGRPHCADGPALAYRDGLRQWFIDGLQLVDDGEKIVMRPETQTVQEIDAEQNGDIRSIRINRFGWDRYLKEVGAECIDHRTNEVEGVPEALYRSPRDGNRLVVTCPTGRMFVLGVPPEITTCEEAQKWLAGGQERAFNVLART